MKKPVLYAVGHSTRPIGEFLELLAAHGVQEVVDVRTIPRSRHNPQYEQNALRKVLKAAHVRYRHMRELGGRRHSRVGSPNTGWVNRSFRGYADHMLTGEFRAGLRSLETEARRRVTAIMCAEGFAARCHRSLIADALSVHGWRVLHIQSRRTASLHRRTPFLRVTRGRLLYPGRVPTAPRIASRASGSLPTGAPFHLEATVRVLQRRPTNRVDIWEGGCHRRVLTTPNGVFLVETRNHGSVDEPDVRFAILNGRPSPAIRRFVAASVRRMLGLDVDPTPIQRWAERVKGLRSTARALRGMRPPRFPSLFETFGSVIPFQQLSLDAGVSIVGRFVERFGSSLEFEGTRWLGFPDPEVVAEAGGEALQSVGLSRQKVATLRLMAEQIASRELTEASLEDLSTPDALAALTDLPGIGPWTAAVILLRGFGRTEVFPPNDTGVARGLGTLLGLKPGALSAAVIERFGEHRGYLYFYSLGSQLLGRGLIEPAPRAGPGGISRDFARNSSSRRRPPPGAEAG